MKDDGEGTVGGESLLNLGVALIETDESADGHLAGLIGGAESSHRAFLARAALGAVRHRRRLFLLFEVGQHSVGGRRAQLVVAGCNYNSIL